MIEETEAQKAEKRILQGHRHLVVEITGSIGWIHYPDGTTGKVYRRDGGQVAVNIVTGINCSVCEGELEKLKLRPQR